MPRAGPLRDFSSSDSDAAMRPWLARRLRFTDRCRPGGDGCLRDRPCGRACPSGPRTTWRYSTTDIANRFVVFSRATVCLLRSRYWSTAVGACMADCSTGGAAATALIDQLPFDSLVEVMSFNDNRLSRYPMGGDHRQAAAVALGAVADRRDGPVRSRARRHPRQQRAERARHDRYREVIVAADRW